jgi:hypothetical protein
MARSYLLDHMYAKKPKEPGTENAPKPRRRTKRREHQQAVQEYLAPEPTPQAPKINIIRYESCVLWMEMLYDGWNLRREFFVEWGIMEMCLCVWNDLLTVVSDSLVPSTSL